MDMVKWGGRDLAPPNMGWQELPPRRLGLAAFSPTPYERDPGPSLGDIKDHVLHGHRDGDGFGPCWGQRGPQPCPPAPRGPHSNPRVLLAAGTDTWGASHGQMHFIGGKTQVGEQQGQPQPHHPPEPLGNRGRGFNLPQLGGWGPLPAGKGRHSLAIPSPSPCSEAGERFLPQTAAGGGASATATPMPIPSRGGEIVRGNKPRGQAGHGAAWRELSSRR